MNNIEFNLYCLLKIKRFFEKKTFKEKKIKLFITDLSFLLNKFSIFKKSLIYEKTLNFHDKINKIKFDLSVFEEKYLFKNKIDICYLKLQAVCGGFDAHNCVYFLFKKYLDIIKNKSFQFEIIEKIENNFHDIKSILIKIIGNYSYNIFYCESGIHKFIRKSVVNFNRHTSFILVQIDKIKDEQQLKINLSEIKIQTLKSSGPGGQHVNKTESAIRITHKPSGLYTKCQLFRSQYQNKKNALINLENKISNLKKKKTNLLYYGKQSSNELYIRSYIIDKSLYKDLINNWEFFIKDEISYRDIYFFIMLKLIKQNFDF